MGREPSLVHPLILLPLRAFGGKCEHLHAEVGSFMRSGCSGGSVLLHCPDTRQAAEALFGCAVTQSRAAAPGPSPPHAVARGRPHGLCHATAHEWLRSRAGAITQPDNGSSRSSVLHVRATSARKCSILPPCAPNGNKLTVYEAGFPAPSKQSN